MDPESFLHMANMATKLKMFPYFDIAHCVITILYCREDLGHDAVRFSRRHPLALWLSCMVAVFSGGLLVGLLLGEPPLAALKNNQMVLLASAVWYLIFYSPFDVGYKMAKFLPIKIALSAMKEVYRVKKINDGVTHAAKLYPNGYLIMIIIGTIKGNGGGFMKIFERLTRGVWSPASFEALQPSFATKASIIASVLFVLDKKTDLISAPHALLYFLLCIFFVYFKLSSTLLGLGDPLLPLENLSCALLLGGVWDGLQRSLGAKAEASPTPQPKNGKAKKA